MHVRTYTVVYDKTQRNYFSNISIFFVEFPLFKVKVQFYYS